jgi:hypothetical protein
MYRVITRLAFAAALALPLTPAFGQVNYQPATVVTLQGDTTRGLIDYRQWEKNPAQIAFKATADGPERTFTPLTIRSFRVAGEQYEATIANVEESSADLNDLTPSSAPQLRPDTMFVRNVVPGSKPLYYYKAASGREYFYTKTGSTFDLLVYKRYRLSAESHLVSSNNLFLNQLSLYLRECPTIQRRLQTTKYTLSSLIQAFNTYYACTNERVQPVREARSAISCGLTAGPSQATLVFSNETSPLYPGVNNVKTNEVVGGLFLNVALPRSLHPFSVRNEVMYSHHELETVYVVGDDPNNNTRITTRLALSYVKLNTLLRYQHPLGAAFGFLNAGMSNGVAFRVTNEKTTVQTFYTTQRTTTSKAFPGLSDYEQGYLVGGGLGLKKLSGELRYEHSYGGLDGGGLSAMVKRYAVLLAYTF